jgi:hypothetical protein
VGGRWVNGEGKGGGIWFISLYENRIMKPVEIIFKKAGGRRKIDGGDKKIKNKENSVFILV